MPNTNERDALPEGWKLIEKKTCYVLIENGQVLATLAGPESVENATRIARALAATAPNAGAPRIAIDFKQATELLAMFGDEVGEVTLSTGEGHSGKGLYAWYSELPEEGAEYLGVTDDEAAPTQPVTQEQHDAAMAQIREAFEEDDDAAPAQQAGAPLPLAPSVPLTVDEYQAKYARFYRLNDDERYGYECCWMEFVEDRAATPPRALPLVPSGADEASAEMIAAGLRAATSMDSVISTLYPSELQAIYRAMREALMTARDHISMDQLRISHCKDAAAIEAALATPPQATLPASEAVAWMDPAQPRNPIGAEKKRDLETINGTPGRILAEKFTVPLFTRAPPQADAAEPVALTDEERQQLADTIDEFIDTGETLTEYAVLLDWAVRGLLECTHFVPTEAGRAAAAQAPGARGQE